MIRAKGALSDYWFTDDAIYRVAFKLKTSLLFLVFFIPVLTIVVLRFLISFVPANLPPSGQVIVIPFLAILFLGWLVIPRYLLARSASASRRAIGVPSKEALKSLEGSTEIRWEQVKSLSITRRKAVRIVTGLRTFKATMEPRDYGILKPLLQEKLGDRLKVREGAF